MLSYILRHITTIRLELIYKNSSPITQFIVILDFSHRCFKLRQLLLSHLLQGEWLADHLQRSRLRCLHHNRITLACLQVVIHHLQAVGEFIKPLLRIVLEDPVRLKTLVSKLSLRETHHFKQWLDAACKREQFVIDFGVLAADCTHFVLIRSVHSCHWWLQRTYLGYDLC